MFFRPKFPHVNSQPAFTGPATCIAGDATGFPCNNVNLLANIPLNELGGGSGTDSWGWTDPRDGREYAIMLRSNGAAFVDITNPAAPIYVGNLPTRDIDIPWRDVKVYQNYAFIGSEGKDHGVQVFDLMQLRDTTNPPVTFSADFRYDKVGGTHNMVINEDSGFAYFVGGAPGTGNSCAGGLHMVDISTPLSPTFAGCFSADGYTHDAQCVIYQGPDTAYTGKEICFAYNADSITIVDVSDKNAPVQISRSTYPGTGYTHQGWLTDDHAWLIANDELDERDNGHNTYTYIWDINDLDVPVLHNIHSGTTSSIDHNLYIKGTTIYEANYRSGLRILDSSNITAGTLTETGYFDTWPSDDNPAFDGAWNVYPYFESGTLIVSDINAGLFTLRPTFDADFRLQVNPSRLTMCGDGTSTHDLLVEQIAGFSDMVTLTVNNLPPNLAVVPTNSTRLPGRSTTLTLTSGNVAPGTYSVVIQGETATRTVTTSLLIHQAETPTVPLLQSPTDGTMDLYRRPMLTWQAVDSDSYRVQISAESDFSTILHDTTTRDPNFPVNFDLSDNTSYYWRIAAQNGCGSSPFSRPRSFTTKAAPAHIGITTTIFATDVETATVGWTMDGNWQVSTDAPYSSIQSFAAAADWSIGEHNLTSPTVTLPYEQDIVILTFWHMYDFEEDVHGCLDGGMVELSADSGTTWLPLTENIFGDPTTNPLGSLRNPLGETTPVWCGDSGGWREVSADLSAWAGDTIRLRFRSGSNQSQSSPGWNIDNIALHGSRYYRQYLPIIISPTAP